MHSVLRKRVVKAAGSAMDVFPVTNYFEYVNHELSGQQIARYWKASGTYLNKAVALYVANQGQTRKLQDGETCPRSKKVKYKHSKGGTEERCST